MQIGFLGWGWPKGGIPVKSLKEPRELVSILMVAVGQEWIVADAFLWLSLAIVGDSTKGNG